MFSSEPPLGVSFSLVRKTAMGWKLDPVLEGRGSSEGSTTASFMAAVSMGGLAPVLSEVRGWAVLVWGARRIG